MEYEDYNEENMEMYDEEFDVFDKREVECCEVVCWEWVCDDCSNINIERKKPRLGENVYCSMCDAVFSSVLVDN